MNDLLFENMCMKTIVEITFKYVIQSRLFLASWKSLQFLHSSISTKGSTILKNKMKRHRSRQASLIVDLEGLLTVKRLPTPPTKIIRYIFFISEFADVVGIIDRGPIWVKCRGVHSFFSSFSYFLFWKARCG